MNDFTIFLLILVIGGIYFLPTYLSTGKVRMAQVFIINLFFGWSVLWWVIALLIAIDKDNVYKESDPEDDTTQPRYTVIELGGKKYRVANNDLSKVQKMKGLYEKGLITEAEYLEKCRPITSKYVEEEKFTPEEQLQALTISFENGEIAKAEYEKKKKKLLDEIIN